MTSELSESEARQSAIKVNIHSLDFPWKVEVKFWELELQLGGSSG